MKLITSTEIQRVYGKASELGMVDNDNHDDDPLHQIVQRETGKLSVKELTQLEYRKVMAELEELTPKAINGMMSNAQKKYAWGLIKELKKVSPSRRSSAERMAGAVRKILGVTSSKKDPLKWVTKSQGQGLITMLKKYIKSAKKKQKDGVEENVSDYGERNN